MFSFVSCTYQPQQKTIFYIFWTNRKAHLTRDVIKRVFKCLSSLVHYAQVHNHWSAGIKNKNSTPPKKLNWLTSQTSIKVRYVVLVSHKSTQLQPKDSPKTSVNPVVPSWLFSQLGHTCVDQLPSLSYRSIFCSNYRKCFPEMWVWEQHLIYFLGLDGKRRHSASRNLLCSGGHQKIHLQGTALSCPGAARQRTAPAELLLPRDLLPTWPGSAATVILAHAWFIVLAPFILPWTPKVSTKLVLLFSGGELIFVTCLSSKKDEFVQHEVSISPDLHWSGGLLP